jgi:hypothetical protein
MTPHRLMNLTILLVAASGACASSMTGGSDGRSLQTGLWGGEHAALSVTDSGAHVDFDCAYGDIAVPLKADGTGRVIVDGVFVQEHGGPIRVDEQPEPKPARYSGQVSGTTFVFDVILIESKENLGTFTVNYNAVPRVRKCR